ncbi:hypothetical protein [Burkholderia pseudomallei]|uniref:hypothetical protein n=1 Tax=Burkholderia pseudomallei TaxID=28450 RepID=UPI00052A2392|nr:hypothetical protein [Burkholderia pseudomallei]AIV91077.1 hypothetical protein X995_807 [Burkholderia pseudomallei B03]AIV95475.1 hypothetical protein X996_759 [Burkholderia pseudomallei A79A]MBO3048044.1 hypothetical protein [Burkholderia pseudomallei]CAJ9608441.1 Uncharacterised protein [Burkholderia pseudomallei]
MTTSNNSLMPSVPGAIAAPADYKNDLQVFEGNLMTFIGQHGLPTQNVLVPVAERVKVFGNVEDVLNRLSAEHKGKSVYVSKFIAAAAAGLFDSALNYLWDETIFELRKRIVRYDLEYFFDIAVTNPDKRKKLSTEDDLAKLDDNELVRGAAEMGLISELGFKHLDFIRYMRNWASAAHPNQNQITGLQLIAWFETCVTEVITLPETNSTAQIRALLANIRAHQLDAMGAKQTSGFFPELTSEQCNSLMSGFFGIYTNDTTLPLARDNVKQLATYLWPFVTEATRKTFGVKYGQFTANNDAAKAKWAREFLDLVGGASYIPDSIRAAEIGTAIDELLAAHRGYNNFHIEPSFARRLESLVGDKGDVPPVVAGRYVDALVEVYLTNGNGIAWSAEPVYQRLLGKFDSSQALLAALSFRNRDIASKLQFPLSESKYREIVALAKTKVSSPQGLDILKTIEDYKAPLQHMRDETKLMEKVNAITQSLGA